MSKSSIKRRSPSIESARRRAPRNPVAADDSSFAPLDLRKVLAVLRRYVWLVVLAGAGTTIVAGYFAYTTPPKYRATAVIRLKDARRAVAGALLERSAELQVGRMVDPLLTQTEVLTSRTVAGAVVDSMPPLRIGTKDFPITVLDDLSVTDVRADSVHLQFLMEGLTATWNSQSVSAAYGEPLQLGGVGFTITRKPSGSTGTLYVYSRDAIIDDLMSNLNVQPRENTDVVDVTFTSEAPWRSQMIVNEVVDAFKTANAREAQEQSRLRREFLETQLAIADSLLADQRAALSTFEGQRPDAVRDNDLPMERAGLSDLQMRREELNADRRLYQVLLSELRDSATSGRREQLRALVASPGIASNGVVRQAYQQLEQYETARDSLTTGAWASAATHPDVQRLNGLISSAEAKLVLAVEGVVASLDARVDVLDQLQDNLRNRTAVAVRQQSTAQAEEARLSSLVQTAQRNADQLRDEYQKARIAEAVEVGQVEIVDLAVLPTQPTGASRPQKLSFGLLMGLALGCAAAFVIDHLNTAIRAQDELTEVLQVPGLMVIPQHENSSRTPRARRIGSESGSKRPPIAVMPTGSPAAEAYSALRTMLMFASTEEKLQAIAVTSPLPEDGKSSVASNLAVAFARQNQRVLLIDCDVRRAVLHRAFAVPRTPGLMGLLDGNHSAGEVIVSTNVENLFLIPAGSQRVDSHEALADVPLRGAVERLRDAFDILIVDTPPVLAVNDALTVATIADGVIVVLRAGRSRREVARLAVQQLRDVGANVLGAVLNDPDAQVPRYGGYYYYRGYHHEKA